MKKVQKQGKKTLQAETHAQGLGVNSIHPKKGAVKTAKQSTLAKQAETHVQGLGGNNVPPLKKEEVNTAQQSTLTKQAETQQQILRVNSIHPQKGEVNTAPLSTLVMQAETQPQSLWGNNVPPQKISTFSSGLFPMFRATKDEDGREWFCLKDVAVSLGLEDINKVAKRIKEDGRKNIFTEVRGKGSSTQTKLLTYIDEPNLYRCIFQSRKPEAEIFQAWVFDVVLPTLRRTNILTTEPSPIAGITAVYSAGEWYYPYRKLLQAIGYGYSSNIGETKRAGNTKVIGRQLYVTTRLAKYIAELRRQDIARQEALLNFEQANRIAESKNN